MGIVLGGFTLPEDGITLTEERGDLAGRNYRKIRLAGIVSNLASVEAVEAALDDILAASVAGGLETTLSLRPGRILLVRRTGFQQDINRQAVVGAFKLELEAVSPYETSAAPTVLSWTPSNSMPSVLATHMGTKWSPLELSFTALTTQTNLSISDGIRILDFEYEIPEGSTLIIDTAAGQALLDGVNVTNYLSGEYPRISPSDTTITLASLTPGGLNGEASLTFRERWW